MATIFTSHPDWTMRLYSGPSVPEHDIHRCSAFLPNYKDGALDETMKVPTNGWPVVVYPILGSWQISLYPQTYIDDNISSEIIKRIKWFLERGYAVIPATVAVTRNHPLFNNTLNPHSDPVFNVDIYDADNNRHYGTNYKGNGLWVEPSIDTSASLLKHPIKDPEWFTGVKSVVMLTQHVVEYGADIALDINSMYIHGSSAGMWTIMRAIWGEELSTVMYPNGLGQEGHTIRNRYKGGYLRQSPSWWPAFQTDPVLADITDLAIYMPASPNVLAGSPYDGWDVPDPTWAFIEPGYQELTSPLTWVSKEVYLEGNKSGQFVFSYDKEDDVGPPYDKTNYEGTGIVAHSIWGGIALWYALDKKHPLLAELIESTLAGEYTAFIPDNEERLDWVVNYWNQASGYTFPFVDPGPSKEPIIGPSNINYYLVDFGNGENQEQRTKYTDSSEAEFKDGDKYLSMPAMEIEFPKLSGFITDDETCVITLPRNSFTAEYETGEPTSDLAVDVYEYVEGENGSSTILHHFSGFLVSRSIESSTLIKLTFNNDKLNLQGPSSVRQDTQCQWPALGHPGCGIAITGFEQQFEITKIIGQVIEISTIPVYDPVWTTYFDKGYVEYEGVRIRIRRWNSIQPSVFILNSEPPSTWLNTIVKFAPGCDFYYSTCEKWENTLNFFGLGIGTPAYDAFATGGPG